jgi:pimeloyl-ACP methyl ester carboxylesterase
MSMMNTRTGFAQTNGIQIHFERSSGVKIPFVFCHGITDNGRCMLRLAEYVAPRFEVILVDARGHGLSEKPERGYSPDDHADDLEGLVKALKLEKPILYGHSMGARTVSRFAAKYPEIPRAVILEDPVYITPITKAERTERNLWLKQMRIEVTRWKTMTQEELVQMAEEDPHPDWNADEKMEWAIAKTQVAPQVFEVGTQMHTIREDFPRITCPVLILKADANPKIRAANRKAAALIPNGKLIHVKGTSHNIRRDDFSATIQYLDEFITQFMESE